MELEELWPARNTNRLAIIRNVKSDLIQEQLGGGVVLHLQRHGHKESTSFHRTHVRDHRAIASSCSTDPAFGDEFPTRRFRGRGMRSSDANLWCHHPIAFECGRVVLCRTMDAGGKANCR
jgi:hypothetical protein